jgi:hypothetical protein
VTGAIAIVIYAYVGPAILRSARINLDAIWAVARLAADLISHRAGLPRCAQIRGGRSRQRKNEARAMLGAIYNSFSVGFETADLKDAKAVLDELDKSGS